MPSSPFRWAVAGIMGSLLLLHGCGEDTTVRNAAASEPAPAFALELFNGGNFTLGENKGKVVVINFFASWCVSCGEETPIIEKVAQEYAPRAVVFLAVAVDDTETKARAFLRKAGLTIPAGLDKSGKIKDAYGIYGMPTTFFIDKAGRVSYLHAGAVTEQLLKHEIDKLL
jgi:thiol-disulfide isomerase/thioredoxin